MLYCAFLSENLSKMGCSRHCPDEHCTLIKKLIREGKTYREVKKMIGCLANMISNALKWMEMENYHLNGSKNSKNGIDSANGQLQGDQIKYKVTCEYCNN